MGYRSNPMPFVLSPMTISERFGEMLAKIEETDRKQQEAISSLLQDIRTTIDELEAIELD